MITNVFDVYNKAFAIRGMDTKTPQEIISMFPLQSFNELYMPLLISIQERVGEDFDTSMTIDETIQMANEEEIEEYVERILERI